MARFRPHLNLLDPVNPVVGCKQVEISSEPSVRTRGMEVNCPAGSREMQCVPLYGWKVVGEGFIEMFFSPPAECHSGFLEEELAQ